MQYLKKHTDTSDVMTCKDSDLADAIQEAQKIAIKEGITVNIKTVRGYKTSIGIYTYLEEDMITHEMWTDLEDGLAIML